MEQVDWTTLIASVIVAVLSGGAGAAFITARANKKTTDTSAYDQMVQAHSALVKDLESVRVARRADNLAGETARKDDKIAFEKSLADLADKNKTALIELETKNNAALAALQAKYDALNVRFNELGQERDKLLRQNWELQAKGGDK